MVGGRKVHWSFCMDSTVFLDFCLWRLDFLSLKEKKWSIHRLPMKYIIFFVTFRKNCPWFFIVWFPSYDIFVSNIKIQHMRLFFLNFQPFPLSSTISFYNILENISIIDCFYYSFQPLQLFPFQNLFPSVALAFPIFVITFPPLPPLVFIFPLLFILSFMGPIIEIIRERGGRGGFTSC